MGVVHTGAVAGKPAVAGGLTYGTGSEIAAATSLTGTSVASMFSTADGTTPANIASNGIGLIDKYNGVVITGGITNGAGVAPGAAVSNTQTIVGKTQTAIAAAKAQLAAAQAANAAAQSATPTSTTALVADIAALEKFLAAASGTAAVAAVDAKTALQSRFTVNVDASTETSSGLTFGAKMRLRSTNAAAAGVSGARVYMKSGAVEVAVGNIWGAIDSMPGLYQSEGGLTGNGAGDVGSIAGFGYDSFNSTGAGVNGAEVIYSAGAFTGHLSVTDSAMGSSANRTAAHVAYTSGDWTVALGTQNSDVAAEDLTAFTVSGKVGDYGVGLSGMRANGESKVTLNGSATFGATTVSAFVSDETTAGAENAYGVGFSHDLGGASLVGAVERNSNGTNYADLGVSFSF